MIAKRAVRMVQDGTIVAASGKSIKVNIDTVCVHGDTPGAVEIARVIKSKLKDAGIEVAPFSWPR